MAYGFNDDKSKRNIDNIIEYKRKLTSGDNLNDITEAGIYSFNTNSVPVNSAYASACFLQVYVEVTGSTFMILQILTRTTGSGQAFRGRYFSGGEYKWTSWSKVATESEITSLNTQVTTNKNNISTLNTQVTGIRNNAVAYIDPNAESEQITRVTMNAGTERTFNLTKKGYYYIYFSRTSASGTLYGTVIYNNGIYLPLSRSGRNNDIEIFIPLEPGTLRVINESTIQAYFGIQYYKPAAI